MSGAPCFAGTRIPVASVIALFDYGCSDARVQDAYPDLTAADVEQARVWAVEEQKRAEILDHQRFLDRVGPAEDFASRLMDDQLRKRIATLEAEIEGAVHL